MSLSEQNPSKNNITFSTCFYSLKNKFNNDTYIRWIHNMLSNVNYYNLVIYTDNKNKSLFDNYISNKNIILIIKPIEEFKLYKYKDNWISNHKINHELKEKVSWELNMLWNEKIHFVHETMINKYFDTPFYGWCDIGYFRNRINDMNSNELKNWCHPNVIDKLNKDKIYYALINNNKQYMNSLVKQIRNKNLVGLPVEPIKPNQLSVAGGFFISHKTKLESWMTYFYSKLELYFKHNYLIKDDQIIIADCIFSRENDFIMIQEQNMKYDNWFLFQRYLSLK